jgi:hypothetical protein
MSVHRSGDAGADAFRFRVSDAFAVPLRGHMLRLRLVSGRAAIKNLKPGRRVRVEGPGGRSRDVTILDHAATGGRQTQDRLDRTRELDVVISAQDAGEGEDLIAIGWFAGPAGG